MPESHLQAIFARVLQHPPHEREAALREYCAGDDRLLADCQRLLGALGAADARGFLADQIAPPDSDDPGALGERPGDRIGPYTLLKVIGEGGFGIVWLAERREPMVQRIALKIIKPGMDSRAVIARFEAERQALAVMDQPGIARVFDAGATPAGRPYFVMEYIQGEPITGYCDRQRLTNRQRLALFARVCDAVQHAHMKGIIHRDLKPSNILVAIAEGGQPRPVVIDFGVAKALAQRLTDKTLYTERGALIGTPEYMSPEQAEMAETGIDTRTDVYALGAILYELLTGALPFDPRTLREAGLAALQKLIREVEAPRPSTRLSMMSAESEKAAADRHVRPDDLAAQLRSELEWIPLKALRKDRTDRYRTAAELGDDIQNYLASRPLIAGPESAAYRTRKFVKRNRSAVAAAAAVLLVLVLGIVGTGSGLIYASRRAEGERLAKLDALGKATDAEAATRIANDARAAEAKAREAVEYQSYVANVQMAGAAMDFRQFDRVRERLDACPERLRGWEWRWLDSEADDSLLLLKGHTEGVNSARFSRDGKRIVTASNDNTARVWDAMTGQSIVQLTGHANAIRSAEFSPDGHRIVTASWDKTARVWDAATGASLAEMKGHTASVEYAAFSPDGTRIVTSSNDGNLRVWDAASGGPLLELGDTIGSRDTATFSPDGASIVAASSRSSTRVWSASTGESLIELKGHTGGINSAAFSPDGARIATASRDKTSRVWDAVTGATLAELRGHTDEVNSAEFIPDGMRIVTSSDDDTARVWDAATGAMLAKLIGHTRSVDSAAFSPDGQRIVTASADGTARLWDAATGLTLAELKGHTSFIQSASFSPDGMRIVTASYDRTARVWSGEADGSARVLKGHTRQVYTAEFSEDGSRVVTASIDSTARVWDAITGTCTMELRGHTGPVHSAAFDADATRIVTASYDKTARVWDAATGATVLTLKGHTNTVRSAAFSPDGTRIVTASFDRTARVWDAATGEVVVELKGHREGLWTAQFSPDGTRIVTAGGDAAARVWDATSGACLLEFNGHTNTVVTAGFSPDGRRIITSSLLDRTAYIWDAATGAIVLKICQPTTWADSARFSPDGSRIVTASSDKAARVWDSATGEMLAELKGDHGFYSAAFSPDGARIVTAEWNNVARVWESTPYRDRLPAIERARAARARIAPRVHTLFLAGQTPDQADAAAAADPALTPEEINLWRAEVMVERDKASLAAATAAAAALAEATRLNSEAWGPVRFPTTEPAPVLVALASAERAVELAPDQADYLNTLGVAQYRAERYADALDSLLRSEAMNHDEGDEPQPADCAFIAMAHWKLGHADDARAALATLRALAAADRWKNDQETIRWLREAESLIEPGAAR